MPTAYDQPNLQVNLETLRALPGKKDGTKISYDNGTGRLSLQEPGKLTSLARTFSHDSVTNRQYFEDPIVGMFDHGYLGTFGVSRGLCDDALRGLTWLRDHTYGGDDATKKAAVDNVIRRVELARQNSLLPGSQPGAFQSIPTSQQWSEKFGRDQDLTEAKIRMLLVAHEMAAPTDEFVKVSVLARLLWAADAWIRANAAATDRRAQLMADLHKIAVAELCSFFRVPVNVLPEKLQQLRTFLTMKHAEPGEEVSYLRGEAREQFRLYFDRGRAFRWKASSRDWALAHTADADLRLMSGAGMPPPQYPCEAGFVMGTWDALYMAKHDIDQHRFHSQYMAGEPVRCAGEMKIVQGSVTAVSNWSGHYLPAPKDLLPVLWYLQQNGANLLTVQVFARTASELVQWRAPGFLMFAGDLAKGRTGGFVVAEWTSPNHGDSWTRV